jgi:hypothetical protein
LWRNIKLPPAPPKSFNPLRFGILCEPDME